MPPSGIQIAKISPVLASLHGCLAIITVSEPTSLARRNQSPLRPILTMAGVNDIKYGFDYYTEERYRFKTLFPNMISVKASLSLVFL